MNATTYRKVRASDIKKGDVIANLGTVVAISNNDFNDVVIFSIRHRNEIEYAFGDAVLIEEVAK